MKHSFLIALAATSALCSTAALAETRKYSVIVSGTRVGHLNVDTNGTHSAIDYDFKNNGRGPTMKEQLDVDAEGLPTKWTISGTTTFGSKVSESFARTGAKASWTDSTGKGSATVRQPSIYVAQSGSPWSIGLYARALLKDGDGSMPALPGGTLRLKHLASVDIAGAAGALPVTAYEVGGIDLAPDTVLMDRAGEMAAYVTPEFIIIREGYEGDEKRLRELAAKWSKDRFVAMQKAVAHDYGVPVRITNVRLFDSVAGTLTDPVSVVIKGNEIASVDPVNLAVAGEATIDGGGGTLLPGLVEMHAHLGQEDAMLNLLAGVTSVRDMGSDNEVLDELIKNIDSGIIAGPRVVRSGFIEGKSPFSSNNGIVVESEAQALDAVRWYADKGFWQIKIYNSMNPVWVPAMIKEAHDRGLRVSGHVPAFSTADAMLEAGYDEITHINQFMLGWVIKPEEDTRTLFRLTALKRLPKLDLRSEPVQRTIDTMVEKRIAIDPTLNIHEMLTQNRDGKVPPGAVDYFDHMPIGWQRSAKKAMVDTSAPGDDAAYRGAFDKIVATLRMLKERGVFIVPGTDTGGAFTYHRELELYQRFGMTPPEILKRATYDVAKYMERDHLIGSIAPGKLADLFLIPGDPTKDLKAIKTIAMVVKDGKFYYPAEVYPQFGIKPFVAAPKVTLPN